MAEGDTIARALLKVSPILEGETLVKAWFKKLRGPKPWDASQITQLDTHGKRFYLSLNNKLVIDFHLGMDGWWWVTDNTNHPVNTFDPKVSAVLTTNNGMAICYKAREIKSYPITQLRKQIEKLGPDLSKPNPDIALVVRNARQLPEDLHIHELLMEQKVAAGIGNIFKSETLHITKQNPFKPISKLTDKEFEIIFLKASELLQTNSTRSNQQRQIAGRNSPSPSSQKFYVYDRYKLGCLRCDTSIERSYRRSELLNTNYQPRSTYWCPNCQQ